MSTNGLIAKLVRNDATRRTQLINQIRTYRDAIFAREIQQSQLTPLIDRMQTLLVGLGVLNAVSQIAVVRQQLRLAASAGYLCAGLPEARPVYVLKDDTSECLHASNTEGIPAGQPNPVNFELYHRPLPDNNDPTDLWRLSTLGNGKSATSQAYDRVLHASTTVTTAQGHKYLYTCPTNDTGRAEEFSVTPVDTPDSFTISGYFQLVSVRTGLGMAYGTETTPAGRPRIYQDPNGSRLYFY
jgi:hypothetical protein